jgi:hypothetical protein
MIQSLIPKGCHLWQNGDPSMAQLRDDLTTLKVYEDETHRIRSLKQCKVCGQLYFYEFYEWIDWETGNDPQYRSWIPVQEAADADALNDCSSLELLSFSRISSDFPATAEHPGAPYWVVRAQEKPDG